MKNVVDENIQDKAKEYSMEDSNYDWCDVEQDDDEDIY